MSYESRAHQEMEALAHDTGWAPRKDNCAALALYAESLESMIERQAEQLDQLAHRQARPDREMPDQPKTRRGDPDHVRRTALQNAPRRGSQRDMILRVLWEAGVPLTAEAITARLPDGVPLNSVSTRMSELVIGSWVQEAGIGGTQHGGEATTYGLTDKARDHLPR